MCGFYKIFTRHTHSITVDISKKNTWLYSSICLVGEFSAKPSTLGYLHSNMTWLWSDDWFVVPIRCLGWARVCTASLTVPWPSNQVLFFNMNIIKCCIYFDFNLNIIIYSKKSKQANFHLFFSISLIHSFILLEYLLLFRITSLTVLRPWEPNLLHIACFNMYI